MTAWYLIRSFGMLAWVAFSLTVALGATAAVGGRSAAAVDRRTVRQLLHRGTAVVGLVALVVHLVLVVLDSYVDVNLAGALVPFTAGWEALAVGLGTLGAYAILLAALMGWARRWFVDHAAERTWRWLHGAAYVGWGLSLVHAILAGTDSSSSWAIATYVAGSALVALALVVRVVGRARRTVVRRADGTFDPYRPATLPAGSRQLEEVSR
ncbi:ferric reductase [Nocardioides bruguierae]|uniref:Ferric reductase n=1 Tax=Nocardioides bruguierae TaxID=2945102 RepID=A0A9X2IF39_9ACTN|nr:ferric reductase [Nocardioides bruguierae]MCM0621456.1 ferric reductase [Nocardioides bruguierae]